MRKGLLGDSYDFVKRSLIHALSPLGGVTAHPMLTETDFGPAEVGKYETILGVRTISRQVLQQETVRADYFRCCKNLGEPLLLDPNTGLKLHDSRSVNHLHLSELVSIVQERPPESLVLVFDQSRRRNLNREGVDQVMRGKLEMLAAARLSACAYVSHACFVFASADPHTINRTRELILLTGVPEKRLIQPRLSVSA